MVGTESETKKQLTMKPDEILTTIVQRIPYPNQMKDIVVGDRDVRFTWRGTRYSVNANRGIDEVGDGVLIGSDSAILMRAVVFPETQPFR